MGQTAAILDADGLRLSREETAFFRDADPWGFILFARNIDTPDQVRALCSDFREAVGRDALITVDQEGGRVQRLRAPHWREWAPPLDIVARTGADAPRAMSLMYRLISAELRAVGIDSNCAPMLDVAGPGTHDFLRNRCYYSDPERVALVGRAVADAHLAGGVLPVVKHMPGHGRAVVDSHHTLPRVSAMPADLHATDFAPFRTLRDLPLGMTAHIVFDALDAHPSTCSAAMIEIIRNDIGFDGLMMTDDISMQALGGDPVASTRAALAAGVDLALYCNGPLAQRRAVAEAAGEMTAAANRRAARALALRQPPQDVDIPALEAEFDALLGGAGHG